MHKVEVSTTFGRFSYKATAQFSEIEPPLGATLKKVLEDGVASVCFRAGGTEAEKALVDAKFMTKEQKRSEVVWSQAAQDVLESAMTEKMEKLGMKIDLVFLGEHVITQAANSPSVLAAKDLEQWKSASPEIQNAMKMFFGVDEKNSDETNLAILAKRYKK